MKRTMFAILGVVILAACIGYFRKSPPAQGVTSQVMTGASDALAQPEIVPNAERSSLGSQAAAGHTSSAATKESVAASPSTVLAKGAASAGGNSVDPAVISRAIDTVLARDSAHAPKQRAWRQLIEAGKLDDAIAALEQKRAVEPLVADYAASLGDAYIKKCSVIHDVRDQGLLAMSADKLFDSALELDPANWEARFAKAVALSFWPASMNKGDEVIGHFQTLIQQQEVRPPQPEFADTYLWLGDQYQKMGQGDNAIAIWNRGASLFPTHEGLQNRLAKAATHQ